MDGRIAMDGPLYSGKIISSTNIHQIKRATEMLKYPLKTQHFILYWDSNFHFLMHRYIFIYGM